MERRSAATTSSGNEFRTLITRTAKKCCLQLTRSAELFKNKKVACLTHSVTYNTKRYITGSAVEQRCVNCDISTQWEGSNIDPYRIETLESIAQNLAQLIRSAGRPHRPNLVTTHSRITLLDKWVNIEQQLALARSCLTNITVHDFYCFRCVIFCTSPLTSCRREASTICPAPLWPWHLTFWPWKWCPSHMWHGIPLCQF